MTVTAEEQQGGGASLDRVRLLLIPDAWLSGRGDGCSRCFRCTRRPRRCSRSGGGAVRTARSCTTSRTRAENPFLGDLYQGLSEHARKTYAPLQTPVFVEEFILDLPLEPAVEEFGSDTEPSPPPPSWQPTPPSRLPPDPPRPPVPAGESAAPAPPPRSAPRRTPSAPPTAPASAPRPPAAASSGSRSSAGTPRWNRRPRRPPPTPARVRSRLHGTRPSLGRAEAAALSEGEGTGRHVERYLVQFWPAKS